MNETENKMATQKDLNACNDMLSKFRLKPPETCYEMNERGMSRLFS